MPLKGFPHGHNVDGAAVKRYTKFYLTFQITLKLMFYLFFNIFIYTTHTMYSRWRVVVPVAPAILVTETHSPAPLV